MVKIKAMIHGSRCQIQFAKSYLQWLVNSFLIHHSHMFLALQVTILSLWRLKYLIFVFINCVYISDSCVWNLLGLRFHYEFELAQIHLRGCLKTSLIHLGNFWLRFRASCWLQDEIKNTSQFRVLFGFRLKSSAQTGRAELSAPRFAHLFWTCRILECSYF